MSAAQSTTPTVAARDPKCQPRPQAAPAGYFQQAVPGVWGIAQAEALDRFVAQAAVAQIGQCMLSGAVVEQHVVKVFACQVIGSVYLVCRIAASTRWRVVLRQGDSRACGEKCHGLDKADAVYFLNEFEGVAAGAAADTVVNLSFGSDAKRGRILVVKGAKAEQIAPLFAQLNVL